MPCCRGWTSTCKYTWDSVVASLPEHIETHFVYMTASVKSMSARVRGAHATRADIPEEYIGMISRMHDDWLAGQDHHRVDADANTKEQVATEVIAAISAICAQANERVMKQRITDDINTRADKVRAPDIGAAAAGSRRCVLNASGGVSECVFSHTWS